MSPKLLTPEQLGLIKEVEDPIMRRRFALLYRMPEELQEKFFAEETTDAIWLVLKSRHQLVDKDLIAVSQIVGLIFLGEVPVKDFIRRLMSDLQIDQPKAAAIAKDINEQIFQPVRTSLMEVHGLAAGDQRPMTSINPPAQTPTPPPTTNYQVPTTPPAPPGPLTLEEIEKRESERRGGSVGDEGSVGNVGNTAADQASRAREELIERLRKAREEQRQNQRKDVGGGGNVGGGGSVEGEKPETKMTAWNGRTIDLRRIPPRRRSPKNGGDSEVEIYEV